MYKKITMFAIIFCAIILAACTEKTEKLHDWQESEFFKSGVYTMIGVEGRVGFIYDKETLPFTKGEPNKYMWHFWGDEEQLKGTFKVVGTHENSNEELIIVQPQKLAGPNNGADYHMPSSMELPESGMWKLDTYFDDKLFESIYVHVEEK